MFFLLCACKLPFLDWLLDEDSVLLTWIGKESSKACHLETGLSHSKLWVVCSLLRLMKDNENPHHLADCIVFSHLL